MEDRILFTVSDAVGRVALNRPDKRNALDEPMLARLEQVLFEIERDQTVRCVLLLGSGKAFCAGADQKRDRTLEGRSRYFEADAGGNSHERMNRCILRMQHLDKPILSSIHGPAVGAGLSLAIASDLRIASESARLGVVFSKVGLIPDAGCTYILPRIVGVSKAMEMAMFGELVDGREAHRIGLTNWVCRDDELDSLTDDLVKKLASGPTLAHSLTKRAVYQGLDWSLEASLGEEARAQAIALRSEDAREGIAAFAQKRRPKFTGR